jgi:hypothetical protein
MPRRRILRRAVSSVEDELLLRSAAELGGTLSTKLASSRGTAWLGLSAKLAKMRWALSLSDRRVVAIGEPRGGRFEILDSMRRGL